MRVRTLRLDTKYFLRESMADSDLGSSHSLRFLLEEECADEKDEQDLDGLSHGAEEGSVG